MIGCTRDRDPRDQHLSFDLRDFAVNARADLIAEARFTIGYRDRDFIA